jgi:predicted amidohydrolase
MRESGMTRTIVLAGAQMLVRESVADSARAIASFVRRAAARGATHLVTPEVILTGYHGRFSQLERDRAVEEVVRPAVREAGLTLMLGAGTFSSPSGRRLRKPLNQVVVIGPDGRTVGTHSKTIPTGGDLKWSARGRPSDLRVFRSGGLAFGCLICNDYWATPVYTTLPDLNLPVRLARMGAKVVFHSIASGHGRAYLDFHTMRLEERAIRGRVWVAGANAVNNSRRPVNAPSGVVGPDGKWRVRAPGRGERLYCFRMGNTGGTNANPRRTARPLRPAGRG